MFGKKAFLKQITSQIQFKSIDLNKPELEGSTPPSVFIGSANYPKVFAGPMLSREQQSFVQDSPEQWLNNYSKEQIINFRLNLLRGKKIVRVNDVENRFITKLQEISLSKDSLLAEAEFEKIPRGITFSEEHQPFGPSAAIKKLETENTKWQRDLQKAYYDTDLLAKDAVTSLYNKGLQFTQIQKALSTGAFGKATNRKLVPTRWSITAADDTLGKTFLSDVKQNEIIDEFRVYESSGLNNYFAVMLAPTQWQYEAAEAFINILNNRTFMFGDYETYKGRTQYSEMGGCYYTEKAVIAEKLAQNNEQAGAFVFREAYPGYVPTGVWLCRELTKEALNKEPKTFSNIKEATNYVNSKLKLGEKFYNNMELLKKTKSQKTLLDF